MWYISKYVIYIVLEQGKVPRNRVLEAQTTTGDQFLSYFNLVIIVTWPVVGKASDSSW
jgi:hypothetical protein